MTKAEPEEPVSPPPERGQKSPRGIRYGIKRVSCSRADDFWSNPLKEERPEDQVHEDFAGLRRLVVQPQAEFTVQPKDGG
jgi:hypothetical protein